jgi:2-polyprenyl-3-methyl-5-hydroxy-6-metoxy-1,4-benzoquinol methylase
MRAAPTNRLPDPAARTALGHYAHVWGRWLSAPFAEVEAQLPTSGQILEIGCGHGLFCVYAAVKGPNRQVLGTDIDAGKILSAQRAGLVLAPRLRFERAVSGEVPAGGWDAIAILDVLYLLPAAAQRRLLAAAAAQLAPGGVLLVKEMAEQPTWKASWNRNQERLSVRVLRITEHDGVDDFTFVPTAELLGWLTDLGLRTDVHALDAGRLHPHQLVTGRRG